VAVPSDSLSLKLKHHHQSNFGFGAQCDQQLSTLIIIFKEAERKSG
jgi:hypothetical protein